ncbi:hypothetical protein SERLADRAFT_417889 [Serpula lacrymans var. lacrymans S7.9]|uniref:NAD(P)-binding protein n=1 Tax=Serpula lacrymans var. lacrymans (strain S7.9) TaxID=578457 RepID=F8P8L8_SERL9|nr:uncharacterized protein SERLADRAFT_417889 [Serpula lacrymans var. lacrymans S7.9]EGO20774.1 hypothetical protein SERLADRAFT_417889 [Serpula lacrymans var. lacrymans S7.9]
MSNHSIPINKAKAISSWKKKVDVQAKNNIAVGIPDIESLFLECGYVMHSDTLKRVQILRLVRPRDKITRADINLLVALVGGKTHNNPYIHPTIQVFVFIKLSTIKQHHKNDVTPFNITIKDWPKMGGDALSALMEVTHIASRLGILILCLELGTKGNSGEFFCSHSGHPTHRKSMEVLLEHNAKTQSEDAIRELKEKTGNEAVFLKLDLANLKFVKAAAEEFLSKETQLHVLFNNAGLMGPPIDLVTEDGYDLQFGTNVVGHHYFTKLLLPVLISTAKTCQDGKVRVVTTSSSGHHFGNLDFNTFKDGPARKKQSTSVMYSQSKYLLVFHVSYLTLRTLVARGTNTVFALELARRYSNEGIVSISLNPGNIRSDLTRYIPRVGQIILNTTILYSVQHGALTQLYAGTTAEGAELNGQYLIPWARVGTPLAGTQDPELGRALWSWLEEQVQDV